MDNPLKDILIDFGKSFYSKSDFDFSIKLFELVNQIKLDEKSAIAAFLMKCDIAKPEIKSSVKSKFAVEIVEKIELLRRIGMIVFPDTQKKILNLRRLFVELTNDLTIIIIKLAERLITLKFSELNNSIDLKRLSEECLYLYSPIAHRLGIRKIYTEMEDIAFKHLYPAEFNRLKATVEKNRNIYDNKIIEMKSQLKEALAKQNVKAVLQSRVKRLYSIYLKLMNKGISLNEIYDLMALRVITETAEDCYLTLGIVHSNWIPIEGRFRDWVTYPKANGYRSIQTTVATRKGDKFEIQIRTNEMHQEAEFGSAAHWAYKEKVSATNIWINRLREFLENDEYFENPHYLLDKLKNEIKRDHINVLTPKGEIVSLPVGATPVDFAFAIHTQLGLQITGARINGKFDKLKTILNSGDVVEAITSKNAKPSRDWLNFVKTSKARSKILIWLKKNESEQIIFEGKRIWEKFKKEYKNKLDGYDDEQKFKNGLNKIGYKSSDDFYSAIAIKSLKLSQSLLRKIYTDAFRKTAQKQDGLKTRRQSFTKIPTVSIEGMQQISTVLSKCCNPIKGEPIVAYVTRNSEIKIHAKRCPIIKSLIFDGDRFKQADWISNESLQKVHLKIIGFGFTEMLSTFIEKSEEESVIILNTERVPTKDRSSVIAAEIEVRDINQLKVLNGKLKSSRSIDEVKVM